MKRNWKSWTKCAGIRALKTFAQTAIATIGTTAIMEEVNWVAVGSASLLAAIMSVLMSLAGLPEVEQSDEDAKLEACIRESFEQINFEEDDNGN